MAVTTEQENPCKYCDSFKVNAKLQKELDNLRSVAKKLCGCFPKEIKGKEQEFDIPRYIIDDVEQALEE